MRTEGLLHSLGGRICHEGVEVHKISIIGSQVEQGKLVCQVETNILQYAESKVNSFNWFTDGIQGQYEPEHTVSCRGLSIEHWTLAEAPKRITKTTILKNTSTEITRKCYVKPHMLKQGADSNLAYVEFGDDWSFMWEIHQLLLELERTGMVVKLEPRKPDIQHLIRAVQDSIFA